MAASLFDGKEAEAWLKIGADILKREMGEQFYLMVGNSNCRQCITFWLWKIF